MKALVLGASGGSGQAVVQELLARGIPTVMLGRSLNKLEQLVRSWGSPPLLECIEGDVLRGETLIPAFEEADIVFQAANVGYVGMEESLPVLTASVMTAAERTSRKVVFVEGVYVYGRSPGYQVSESYPMRPHTRKGQAKLAMAREVFSERWSRAQAAVVRLPDYYGPTSQMAYLDPTFQALVAAKPAIFIGNLRVRREYVYLPDAAKMIVEIALREESYGQTWHIPGSGLYTGKEILEICRNLLRRKTAVFSLGPISVKLIGLFDPFFRELSEMMYMWKDPPVLDGTKYELEVGPIPRTPLEQGLAATLDTLTKDARAAKP